MNNSSSSFPVCVKRAFQQVYSGSETISHKWVSTATLHQFTRRKTRTHETEMIEDVENRQMKMPESGDKQVFSSLPLKVFVDDID